MSVFCVSLKYLPPPPLHRRLKSLDWIAPSPRKPHDEDAWKTPDEDDKKKLKRVYATRIGSLVAVLLSVRDWLWLVAGVCYRCVLVRHRIKCQCCLSIAIVWAGSEKTVKLSRNSNALPMRSILRGCQEVQIFFNCIAAFWSDC